MAATRNLPRPVTTTELYLAAILDELTRQNQPPEPPPGKTVLRELPVVVSSVIPPAFPGAKALNEAGIFEFDEIPRVRDELLKIRGIGAATADAILNGL